PFNFNRALDRGVSEASDFNLPLPVVIHAVGHRCMRLLFHLSVGTCGSTCQSPSAQKQSRCRTDEFPHETLETPFAARSPAPANQSGCDERSPGLITKHVRSDAKTGLPKR